MPNGPGAGPVPRTPDWKLKGGMSSITADLDDPTVQASRGANSGVPRTMTQAGGKQLVPDSSTSRDSVTIPANWKETQSDVSRALTWHSLDMHLWTKLGHLPFEQRKRLRSRRVVYRQRDRV
jgi:hypothetical protein